MKFVRAPLRIGKGSAVIGACITVALLTACSPSKPPPPPPSSGPHDVLVVGDSLSYSYGCVLGDNAGSGDPCPAQAGFTTWNAHLGACNIGGGTLLAYNGGLIGTYSCSDWPSSWAQLANEHQPKVVVITTSGWEIVDRWSNYPGQCNPVFGGDCPIPPDLQWGAADTAARDNYAANLTGAINLFKALGAQHVLVANAPYVAPPEPFFVSGIPTWYERYQSTQGDWVPPSNAPGFTYRPSKAKIDQLNTAVASVVSSFGGNGVTLFNAYSHFSPGGVYSDNICPPPNDAVSPSGGCPGGQSPIPARDPDGVHLTLSPGGNDVLAYYLRPCIRGLLGLSGGDVNACN